MRLVITSLLAVASAKFIQDAAVASDTFDIFNQVAADAMRYLESEGIFELTDHGFDLNASPYFAIAADSNEGHYSFSYGKAPVNTVDINLNTNVGERHVITHTGSFSKLEDIFTFFDGEPLRTRSGEKNHSYYNLLETWLAPCPLDSDFKQIMTVSHINLDNLLNNEHRVTVNGRACGKSLDVVDTFRIDSHYVNRNDWKDFLICGARNEIAIDVSPDMPSSTRDGISTVFPLDGDRHSSIFAAESEIESRCFEFQPCNGSASIVAIQNGGIYGSITSNIEFNDFTVCTGKSNNRPDCGTITYEANGIDWFSEDIGASLALRMNDYKNFQFVHTKDGVEVASMDVIAESREEVVTKSGIVVPGKIAAPELVARMHRSQVYPYPRAFMDDQGYPMLYFIRFRLNINGDEDKYMLRIPLPAYDEPDQYLDIKMYWWGWQPQYLIDSIMTDMSGDVPEDEHPNWVYAVVYGDVLLRKIELDHTFDVYYFDSMVDAVGFELTVGRLNNWKVLFNLKYQHKIAKRLSEMINEALQNTQIFIKETRWNLWYLTCDGIEGEGTFAARFADVLRKEITLDSYDSYDDSVIDLSLH